uniref:Uncharacterized protein n=1 Tax=Amphimedon queenslandica TaxID=400682 RepID=A0A1X7SN80_AMPQE
LEVCHLQWLEMEGLHHYLQHSQELEARHLQYRRRPAGAPSWSGTRAPSWRSPSYPRTAFAATAKAGYNCPAQGCEQTNICQFTK